MEPHLKSLGEDINTLCEVRLKLSESKKTDDWTIDDLKVVLKHLEKDKSRDPEGYANKTLKKKLQVPIYLKLY